MRKIVPDDTSIRIFSPPEYVQVNYDWIILNLSPTTFAWEGGRNLENSPLFNEVVVSRAEYLESGARICEERFSHWYFNNLWIKIGYFIIWIFPKVVPQIKSCSQHRALIHSLMNPSISPVKTQEIPNKYFLYLLLETFELLNINFQTGIV